MMSGFILLLEIGLFALLLFLAFRMLILARSERLAPALNSDSFTSTPQSRQNFQHKISGGRSKDTSMNSAHHPDKCELISKLLILASLQERDCREQGLDLEASHIAVREYAVAWLYGAAAALSTPVGRNPEMLAHLVSHIASRKLGIRQPDALGVVWNLTGTSGLLVCYRGGIEGAEHWEKHHFVPREISLYEAVTSSTFV